MQDSQAVHTESRSKNTCHSCEYHIWGGHHVLELSDRGVSLFWVLQIGGVSDFLSARFKNPPPPQAGETDRSLRKAEKGLFLGIQ